MPVIAKAAGRQPAEGVVAAGADSSQPVVGFQVASVHSMPLPSAMASRYVTCHRLPGPSSEERTSHVGTGREAMELVKLQRRLECGANPPN